MIHSTEHTDSGEPILASVDEVPTVEVELPEWTGPFCSDAELSACDAEYDAYYGDLGVRKQAESKCDECGNSFVGVGRFCNRCFVLVKL